MTFFTPMPDPCLTDVVRIPEQPLYLLQGHAQTIVRHAHELNPYPCAMPVCGFPVAVHEFHTVIDGIFHQGLEDKLETGQVKDLIPSASTV